MNWEFSVKKILLTNKYSGTPLSIVKKQQKALPEKLVRQAVAIAEKFGVYGLKLKK